MRTQPYAIASAPRTNISAPPLAYQSQGYVDSTTTALDRLTNSAVRRNWILEISEIILIPAIILSGITGIVYFLA